MFGLQLSVVDEGRHRQILSHGIPLEGGGLSHPGEGVTAGASEGVVEI